MCNVCNPILQRHSHSDTTRHHPSRRSKTFNLDSFNTLLNVTVLCEHIKGITGQVSLPQDTGPPHRHPMIITHNDMLLQFSHPIHKLCIMLYIYVLASPHTISSTTFIDDQGVVQVNSYRELRCQMNIIIVK